MNAIMDMYIDYLICSTSYTTATGLSALTDKKISHDAITRMLSEKHYDSRDLWLEHKGMYLKIKDDDGVLIFDDSNIEKAYMDENDLITWHFDHSKSQTIKGINLLTCLYQTSKGSMPIGYETVRKTEIVFDKKTSKNKRKARITKQQHFRNLLSIAKANNVSFKYVLADIWFASAENMKFISQVIQKNFVMPIKSNRKVTLISEDDNIVNNFVRIDSIDPGEATLVRLEGVDFPLRFTRQVFKNEDGSTGCLYLVSNDIELTNQQIQDLYQRRWKVEVYHKSLKNNLSIAKSPARTVKTQANHLFASLCAYIRIEEISLIQSLNHFAIKSKIYLAALKKCMIEFQSLKIEVNSKLPISIQPCVT